MSQLVASLFAKIGADTRELEQGLDKAHQGMTGLGSQAQITAGLVGAAFAAMGAAGLAFGMASFTAASDAAESANKMNVVFGEAAASVKEFTDSAGKNLGMSSAAAMEAAGTFGNLFLAMGQGPDAAAEMSMGIVTLAADLASFNNISPEIALEKLRAGLVGEAEPLRVLGVNLTEATVKAKAMEMGFRTVGGELSQAAKLQARYALILEQTGTAQGDFARTSDGAANSSRILQAQFADMQTQIGERLLPVGLAFINALRGIMDAFDALPEPVKTGIVVIGALVVGLALIAGPMLALIGFLPMIAAGFGVLTASVLPAVVGLIAAALPIIAITVAGIALGVAIAYLITHWQDFTDFLGKTFQPVIDAVVAVWQWLMGNTDVRLEISDGETITITEEKAGALQLAWNWFTANAGRTLTMAWEHSQIKAAMDSVQEGWNWFRDNAGRTLNMIWEHTPIKSALDSVQVGWNWFRDNASRTLTMLADAGNAAVQSALDTLHNSWDWFSSNASRVLDLALGFAAGAVQNALDTAQESWKWMGDNSRRVLEIAMQTGSDLVQRSLDTFQVSWTWFSSNASRTLEMAWATGNTAAENALDTLKTTWTWFYDNATRTLGVLEGVGTSAVQAVLTTIKDTWKGLQDLGSSITLGIQSYTLDSIKNIIETIKNAWKWLLDNATLWLTANYSSSGTAPSSIRSVSAMSVPSLSSGLLAPSSMQPAGNVFNITVTGNTLLGSERSIAQELARILQPELDALVRIAG